MLIAQITDTHIRRAGQRVANTVETNPMLADAVAAIGALHPAPDVMLITGDLVEAGADEEYEALRALLRPLSMPIYVIPGNHDSREAMRRSLPEHRYLPRDGDFLHYVVEDHPIRLVALDTVIAGSRRGMLCAQRLAWLDARLAEAPGRPAIVFMHHPPFATGIAFMDRYGLDGREGFAEVVARHPQIERILCGHIHRPVQFRLGGTIASVAPSVVHQVALDLRAAGPSALVLEPPAYQLHLWREDAGLVSHTAYVRRYSDWYAFDGSGPVPRPDDGTPAVAGALAEPEANGGQP